MTQEELKISLKNWQDTLPEEFSPAIAKLCVMMAETYYYRGYNQGLQEAKELIRGKE